MCTDHQFQGISRRGFAAMAVAGAGLTLLPTRLSAAAKIDALCIMCIDFRLVDTGVHFFDTTVGTGDYDFVALAGASLAGVPTTQFNPTDQGFWIQVATATNLHEIQRVVVLDHMDCGAYAAVYNGGKPMDPDAERAAHRRVMQQVNDIFFDPNAGWRKRLTKPAPKGIEFYLTSPTEHITL